MFLVFALLAHAGGAPPVHVERAVRLSVVSCQAPNAQNIAFLKSPNLPNPTLASVRENLGPGFVIRARILATREVTTWVGEPTTIGRWMRRRDTRIEPFYYTGTSCPAGPRVELRDASEDYLCDPDGATVCPFAYASIVTDINPQFREMLRDADKQKARH